MAVTVVCEHCHLWLEAINNHVNDNCECSILYLSSVIDQDDVNSALLLSLNVLIVAM